MPSLLCPSFFARLICGRRSVAQKLDVILTNQTRMETMMTATKAELLNEIAQVKDEVAALLKGKDEAVAAAVAKAKAAWDADNEAEHTEAMAALEEIRKSLSEAPVFTPSGN
jgi:formate-dependent nitrite reductase cytochrome c552 subunit